MGVMFDYFRAADDDAAKRAGGVLGGPVAVGLPDVIETKWVDPWVRVGKVYFRLQDRDWEYDAGLATQVLPGEPIGPDNWEEPTVWLLSDALRDHLADVPEDARAELGRWWSTTEEFALDRTEPTYVEMLCANLLQLCRDARDHDEHLYVWSSM